jgi:hypothetical protein
MTRITTSCPRCGRIELGPDDVTLVISPHEDNSWYLFDCTGCVQRVVKPAPATVAIALGSVSIRTWTVPAEILERVLPGEAPPIGDDDLLDLILDLRRDDLRHQAQLADHVGADHVGADHVEQLTNDVPRCLPEATAPNPGAAGSRPARPNAA